MHEETSRCGGVDWANDAHAVCVVDTGGVRVKEFDVAHSADGLAVMCRRLHAAGVTRVAIERPDGPVVDALLEAHLEVVVVSSRSVKALRERYGTSGNKSDRSDAGEAILESRVRASDNRVGAIVDAYDKALAEVLGKLVAWTNQAVA